MKPKLLDLFCCAGGAAMGYHRAGFDVTGIDIKPQPRYPFQFIQADALEYLAEHGHEYDAIHASPPCQGYSKLTPTSHKGDHPKMIPQVRALLQQIGKPYVIENVESARNELINPVMLCGTMFGLNLYRHRYFEYSGFDIRISWGDRLYCRHAKNPVLVSGSTWRNGKKYEFPAQACRDAMGIDWMIRKELDEALPPVFTEFMGKHLIAAVPAMAL